MLKQPHEALSCRFNKIDSIVKELGNYFLHPDHTQLIPLSNALGNPVYMLVAGTGCKAKPFGYPIKINVNDKDMYIVDCRTITSVGGFGSYKVTNHGDFELLKTLGLMTSIWDSGDQRLVANIATDLSPIFATWLSSTISAAFNLAIDQRTELSILAAFYYWQLLNIEDNVDKIASRIAIDLKLEFDRVIEVCENAGEVTNLDQFVTALKATSGGIRLEKTDVATIYQVSTGVWSGALGRATMEIATEYPPYIVALAFIALTDKSYKRTRFFEYVSLFDRRPDIKQLPESVSHLFKTY